MADRTLLERIAGARAGRPAGPASQAAVLASVVANLRLIFNARQGCATSRPDFGMPDFGDLMYGLHAILPEIARAIKTQIEAFEPRLAGVQVRQQDDTDGAGGVRFAIRATLVGEESGPIVLSGALSGDGHLEVRA